MALNWTDAEVFQLISCWAEEGIQEQLEGCKRNKHVYERLLNLAEYNIEKTGEQCRTKVKKLHQEYKKIKDKQKLTGKGRAEWKYFNKLDEILATRPATRPPVLVETLDSQPIPSDQDSDETDAQRVEENNVQESQDHSSAAGDVSDNQSGNSTIRVSGTPPSHRNSISSSPKEDSDESSTANKVEIKGKKRKQSKGEVLEDAVTKVMKTMTDGLRNSDKMFMELEEKRLKFEEQQRREEREFQLRMIQMLHSGMGGNSMYPAQCQLSHPTSSSGLYYSPPGSNEY